jgi:hypothetical protein
MFSNVLKDFQARYGKRPPLKTFLTQKKLPTSELKARRLIPN